ncbi:thioesterase family protein [Herbiconiux sp. CPCC 203407]|uniref:Thioesterase family protein n=1 Tax=Herbiconiux oxytropis TaxID=2970915 RepID=A0AA41XED1_9MICO|nr:acyl-CoA thioesterase domain-containing protein [Herbiconiux oxytropis]MCS5721731.1 thioesterase family protein [Herbiconiux oxytropis]MCS5726642.1 thioesterase family protein [Herbiconiux oxytropis]
MSSAQSPSAAPSLEPTSAPFLAAVDLTDAGGDVFTARTQYVPWPKAYGGDMVVQALAAAIRTTDSDRRVNSFHGHFLRPVDVSSEVSYAVDRVRDGRGYSTRTVTGQQNGKSAFIATVTFQVPEDGPDLQIEMPTSLPAPSSLPSSAEAVAGVEGPAAAYWASGRSFDMRHVPSPVYFDVDGAAVPHQAVWVRAFDALPDDLDVHRTALAYVCDYTILESALRATSTPWAAAGLATASLDHAMWFHRDGRADEWVLYAQQLQSLQSSRALVHGSFFSIDGRLLASVAQEGMIRLPSPTPPGASS